LANTPLARCDEPFFSLFGTQTFAMLPSTLALIDDDKDYAEFLAQYLREQGVRVRVYADSNDLLADADGHRYEFYVVDLMLPGVNGVELIKILRRRTNAGLLVVSGRMSTEVFKEVIAAGADMYLSKPVQFEQVAVAIGAVQRRVAVATPTDSVWRLDWHARELVAPDGARIELSGGDLTVMECFLNAKGAPVERDVLRLRLGIGKDTDNVNGLNATIYRLRRRIERATPVVVPLQSKSRVGYVFKAPLEAV
jgi:two-component system, OmpR family, response regulator